MMSPKSHALAVVLAIFLGALGVHRFYLGHVGSGCGRLILTICCAPLLLIPVLNGIIMILILLPIHVIDIFLVASKSVKPANGSAYV
jgi:TM2 domain-containing membrane protein YozV